MENRAGQIAIGLLFVGVAMGSAWAFHAGSRGQPDGLAGAVVLKPQDRSRLQSGDIVFRRGRDAVSGMVLALDGRLPYSHVGIVDVEEGRVWVIHASPAEGSETEGKVKREAIEIFSDQERAALIGVYRMPRLTAKEARQVVSAARGYLGRPFDAGFDLGEDQRIYCSELVWLAYRQAGVELTHRLQELHMPLHQGPVILPGAFVADGMLVRII